jgi:hypothetical protein
VPADAAFAGGLRFGAGDWAPAGISATDITTDPTARADIQTFIVFISPRI